MIRAGAAAVHIEDQVAQKTMWHRPNKEIVSQDEMVDQVKAAADARTERHFLLWRGPMPQQQGLSAAIERHRLAWRLADGISPKQ